MWLAVATGAGLTVTVLFVLGLITSLGSRAQERHVQVPVTPQGVLPPCNGALWMALLSVFKSLPLVGRRWPRTRRNGDVHMPNISVTAKGVATDVNTLVSLTNLVHDHAGHRRRLDSDGEGAGAGAGAGAGDVAGASAGAGAGDGARAAPASPKRRGSKAGAPFLAPHLPMLYFDVVSSRLGMLLLAHGRCPFNLLGAVKLSARVTQHAAASVNDKFDFHVSFVGGRPHRRGTVVEVRVVVTPHAAPLSPAAANGDEQPAAPVWESVTSILFFHSRRDKASGKSKPSVRLNLGPIVDQNPHTLVDLMLPFNLGRLYGALCRDFNPIHMYSWCARLFGFRGVLAHGMCIADLMLVHADQDAARCLTHDVYRKRLPRVATSWPIVKRELVVEFRKPAYLGKTATCQCWTESQVQLPAMKHVSGTDRPQLVGGRHTATVAMKYVFMPSTHKTTKCIEAQHAQLRITRANPL